jgi:hypothetical protein
MKPIPRFGGLDKEFWAHVRAVSESVGYTSRQDSRIKVPGRTEIGAALSKRKLETTHILTTSGKPTALARLLEDYFVERARVLNSVVEPQLMDSEEAKALFDELRRELKPSCPLPMNKQTGDKKTNAYLTCIVNMLVEANSKGSECDYDPRALTTFTQKGRPLRTLARRVDGAFPSTVNPVAIWEVKEYYHTTTFGSRVADGVYETLLDGMELEELRGSTGIIARHYLIVDSHFTWWKCGRSYLCRMIDMLHMGYVDEIIFGREVLTALPSAVREWVAKVEKGRSG